MKASDLHTVLSEHANVRADTLDKLYNQLPEHASVAEYRDLLVKSKTLKYTQIMDLFFSLSLSPRSNVLIAKLAAERKKKKNQIKTEVTHDYHLENAQLKSVMKIANERLSITIPTPSEKTLNLRNSDEKQAVMLALEMAHQGQPSETEIILLETIESFENSSAAMTCLSWTYLSSGHPGLARQWANRSLASRKDDKFTMELLPLTEIASGKFLLACAHYQQLLRKEKAKPLWYILLATAQEATQCKEDAIENYKVYLTIGKDTNILKFAAQHIKELSHR